MGGGAPGRVRRPGRFRLGLLGRVRGSVRRFHGRAAAWRRASGRSRGSDLRYNLRSRWKRPNGSAEARSTCPPRSPARSCDGHRREGGAEPVTCPTCSGMGKVRAQQGFFTVERTCPTCSGRARSSRTRARPAAAQGRVAEGPRACRSTSPQGSKPAPASAWPARARPACAAARRAISTSSSRWRSIRSFQRDGMDLFCRGAGQSMTDRRAGRRDRGADDRWRPVPGEGTRRLSQSGRQMRLRGKGMPALRGTGT
jgi:molecular chaperone DnaJ